MDSWYCPIGANWCFKTPPYFDFSYFKFTAGTGGHANTPARLNWTVNGSYNGNLEIDLKNISEEFPQCRFWLNTYSAVNFEIDILNLAINDYDLHVAKMIESRISEKITFDSKLLNASGQKTTLKFNDDFKLKTISLDHEKMSYVNSITKGQSGSMKIRIDFHDSSDFLNAGFIAELSKIIEKFDFKFAYYKFILGNYMLFIGNGRLGVKGEKLPAIDVEDFVDQLDRYILESRMTYKFKKECSLFDGYYKDLISSEEKWLQHDTNEMQYFM